jgi:YndJ-like protein
MTADTAPFPIMIGQLTLVDLLLLLAPILIVPLGLRLVPLRGRWATRILRLARLVQPAGAVAAVIAFLLPQGWTAGVIALGWLCPCALASLAGLAELLETRSWRPVPLVSAAALAYLSVGAAWLVASRAGMRLGFSPAIVELTGVHFHYAGFAATLLAALAIRALRSSGQRVRGLATTAALMVVVGTPLTAVGITTRSAAATIAGPALLAGGILTIAGITAFLIAPALENTAARWLLRFSAAGVLLPMLLGVDYAVSRVLAIPALDLPWMAAIHGDLNALAFVLPGLLGWTLLSDQDRNRHSDDSIRR